MAVCQACGTTNPDGVKFCHECGGPIAAAAPAREQRKTVTVLFTDVTGSTELGERLDPESLRRVLARFFDLARTVIERHGGTVEKFIGDAVMAVFGVPVLHEDDALRATRAAAELRGSLGELNEELGHGFGITLQTRTGVNTGEVVTGTTERLATGDAVNLAARLQRVAAPGEVLLGRSTLSLVLDAVVVEELEPVVLKGKAEPVTPYRLLDVKDVTRRPGESALVGRVGQLQLLNGVFTGVARDRSCGLFTLLGPAGVGKSRLVAEFLQSADATVVQSRCLSYGEGITYWPVTEILQQLRSADAAERIDSLLASNDAVRASVEALRGEAGAASTSTEIAWSVRLILEAAAVDRPLVVVLDDLHWAEPTLLDLVEHIVDLSRNAPILLFAVARQELLERRPGWGGGKLNATTLLLEPLAGAEADELLDRLGPQLPADVRSRVREAADGNPLFLEEMVALVEAGGTSAVDVPPTISALLAARLDQLEAGERRVLETGSVEGQTFHRGAVTALAPGESAIPDRLIGLVRKDLLRPTTPELPHEEAFRFRHLLIRDAAYDALAKSTRAQLHERFADWLDAHGEEIAESDEIVGYHLEQAHRYRIELGPEDELTRALAARAASRLEGAGRRALTRGDAFAAMRLLERARGLFPSGELDVGLELEISHALFVCGRPEDAVARVRAIAEAAAAAGDEVGAARATSLRLRLEMHLAPEGIARELQEHIERARPLIEASGDDAAMAALWAATAGMCHYLGRHDDALVATREWIACATRADSPDLRHAWVSSCAQVAYGSTPVEEALEWVATARAAVPAMGPVIIDHSEGDLLALKGDFDGARAAEDRCRQANLERGQMMAAAMLGQSFWHVEMAAGDFAAAEQASRRSCEELDLMGERALLSTTATQLAQALYELGRYDEAGEWAARGIELAEVGDVATQTMGRQVQAKLLAREGRHAAARELMDEVRRASEHMQAPVPRGFIELDDAEVAALAGDKALAEQNLNSALDRFVAKGAVAWADRAKARLAALAAAD